MSERWDDASDRFNPLIVKEVRQGLRTRTFVVTFSVLLAVDVLIAITATRASTSTRDLGVMAFGGFFGCFVLAGFLALPIGAHRAFTKERDSDAWALLQLTGMSARRLLLGKIASTLVQGALYASATAPFLLFGWFLGGIGLVTIAVIVAVAFVLQALTTLLAVCSATYADSRFGRSFISGVLALSLVLSTLSLASIGPGAIFGLGLMRMTPSWSMLLGPLLFLVTLAALLFEAAASRLMPPSNNDALGPRLTALVHLLAVALLALVGTSTAPVYVLPQVLAYGTLVVAAFGLFSTTGDETATRRWRRTVPLLRPGPHQGFRFTLLLAGVVGASALALTFDAGLGHDAFSAVAPPAWAVLVVSLGSICSRVVTLGGASMRRVVTASLGVGMLLAGTSLRHGLDKPLVTLLNPFILYGSSGEPWLLVLISVLAAIVADRVLARGTQPSMALGVQS